MSWTSLSEYYPHWVGYQRWRHRIPGVQLAMRERGELRLDEAFGWAELDGGVRLSTDHLFRIASHSKTFAAVLVLQLVETGRLRLDDTLGTHVADLDRSDLADRTLRELLSHSGGVIRDGEYGDFWQATDPFPDRAALIELAGAPSAAVLARNEHFKYSNVGYGLIGLVLEAVTGSSFADLLHARIAEPLALTDLGGEYDASRASDYAAGYTPLTVARDRTAIEHVDTRALAAATGCYATARDLSAFFSALLPGRTELISADAQRQQRHWVWDVKQGESRYGLGMALQRVAETELFGHTGGYPGHSTCTFADPESGLVVSVLTNAIDGSPSAIASCFWQLRTLGRQGTHATCTPEDAAPFTGRYAATWGVTDIVRLDDRLYNVSPIDADPSDEAVPLEIIDATSLRMVGGRGGNSLGETMRFEFDDDGRPRSMRGDSGMTMTPFTVPDEP